MYISTIIAKLKSPKASLEAYQLNEIIQAKTGFQDDNDNPNHKV